MMLNREELEQVAILLLAITAITAFIATQMIFGGIDESNILV